MKVYEAANIRNVAVVGHGGCGKTQLVSALLFASGMVNRLGQVDEGNTVTDYDDEEIARKHTLAASLAYAEWNKTKINLIDTPGFGNFFSRHARRRCACRRRRAARRRRCGRRRSADRESLGGGARSSNLPRMVVLNRLDRERASLERTLESLRQTLRPRRSCRFSCRSARSAPSRASSIWSAMKAYTFADRRLGQADRGRGARRPGRCRRPRRARR